MKIIEIKKIPRIKKTYFMGIPIITRTNENGYFSYSSMGITIFKRKHFKKDIEKKDIPNNQIKNAVKIAPVTDVNLNSNKKMNLDRNYLNVAFKLTGGLGDLLISANYLEVLHGKLNSNQVRFHIYAHRDIKIARAVFKGLAYVASLHTIDEIRDDCKDFDLFAEIQRYPFIRFQDRRRIYRYAPFLIEMIFLWERFRVENSRFWLRSPWFDGQNQIEVVNGRKRIQQPDVYGRLGIGEDYQANILIEQNEDVKLSQLNLEKEKYITVHRGVDAKIDKDSNKLWPLQYYNLLIEYIKKNFPEYKIVQLGVNEKRCPEFKNVDLYLAGKTTLDDIKVILKHSKVHIDGEGGFVHLRNALHGGPSLVFFGPTSDKFYGYSQNLNMRGKGCPSEHGCEWVRPDWQKRCVGNFTRNECLYSLSPETAFKGFCQLMEH